MHIRRSAGAVSCAGVVAAIVFAGAAVAAPSPPDAAVAANCRTAAIHLRQFGNIKTANGRVRIWWLRGEPDDAKRAQAYRSAIDSQIWPSFVSLLGAAHQPLSDAHTGCPHGRDGRLDIYILHGAFSGLDHGRVGLALPYPAGEPCQNHAPVFLAIRPQMPRSVLAHEIFHAFQGSYRRLGSCIDYSEWDEATAAWAQDRVYPGDQDEHAFKGIFDRPDVPLTFGGYSAWAFLQAVTKTQRQGPKVVAKILQLEESIPPADHDATNIVDKALPGGFAIRFPEFALRAWNQKPIPTGKVDRAYAQWDAWRLVPRVGGAKGKPTPKTKVELKGKPLRKDKLERGFASLRILSREYYHFDFSDPKVRLVALTDPGQKHFRGSPGAGVQAFVRIGSKWTVEDWSDGRDVSFCRDKADQDVNELVIVLSNSSYANRIEGSQRPVLESSNFCEASFKASAFRRVNSATGARGDSTIDAKFVAGPQQITTVTRDPLAQLADPTLIGCDPSFPCTFNLKAKLTNDTAGHVNGPGPGCNPQYTYPAQRFGPFEPDVIFATLDLAAAAPGATFETQPGNFEIGDVTNDTCGAHSFARVTTRFTKLIPLETLVSGKPITISFTGSGTQPTEPFSTESSIGWQWTYMLTFARVKRDGSAYP